MNYRTDFYMDIKQIRIVHKCILNQNRPCEYSRGRGSFGLVYILDGEAEYRFSDGERIHARKGNILFFAPNAAYSVTTEKELPHYTVNFDIYEDTSRLGQLGEKYYLVRQENTEQLERIFRHLVEVWTQKKRGYEMQATGILCELLTCFYYDFADASDHRHTRHRLIPAIEYIEQHFDQPMTLEQLASLANMSVTNFRREWAKQYTQAPMQYRDSLRLYYGKEYLLSGYYSVSEVARKCGFEDVSYFVRFFKKRVGLTPGEFQKNI